MIKTPISRIIMPDVPRLLSALKSIQVRRQDAKQQLEKIAESVLSEERMPISPFVSEQKDFIATDNQTLFEALSAAKEGQIVFVPAENVIDMADYLLCYNDGKPMQPIVPKGVTLMGERGVGDSRGAIIKATCVARPLFILEDGARITGLSLGGRDLYIEEHALTEHQSVAVVVAGDNVTIDNCEIAGFSRCAIDATGVKNLKVSDCYIHDIAGVNVGRVIVGEGAEATLSDCTFIRVNGIDGTKDGQIKIENSQTLSFPKLENPADVELPCTCNDSSLNDLPYNKLRAMLKEENVDEAALLDLISDIGLYSNYLKYPKTIAVNGEHYGPSFSLMPWGGGAGYENIYTDGDYVVHDGREFLKALEECQEEDVIFIDGQSVIDIPDELCYDQTSRICIDKKVTIASNRGERLPDGSIAPGGAFFMPHFEIKLLGHIKAAGVRFAGLILKGPDNSSHIAHHKRCFSKRDENGNYVPGHAEYYKLKMGYCFSATADDVVFENCEICNFSFAALSFGSLITENRQVVKSFPVKNCAVHHCYIHHTQLHGLGYGVQVRSGDVDIYANLFNYNRHSIASPGFDTVVYHAHDNIEMGDSMGDHFDIHGGRDRKDGSDIAGKYCEIYNNTFLSTKNPYNLRGRITDERHFDYNVCFKPREEYDRQNVEEKKGKYLTHNHYGRDEFLNNVHIGKNIWSLEDAPILLEGGCCNE